MSTVPNQDELTGSGEPNFDCELEDHLRTDAKHIRQGCWVTIILAIAFWGLVAYAILHRP